jgi:tetratricopeptide (TPR) repeat protein
MMPAEPNPPALKLLQLAAKSLQDGRVDKAEAHLRGVLRHDAANSIALHHLALRAYERGLPDEATTMLERALVSAPDDLNILTSYATILQELGRPREALEIFLRILAIDSTPAVIWNAAGICMQETGQPAKAVEFYLRAIGLQPDLAEAYSNLGAVMTNEGDLDGAIENFRQALQLKPDFADCYTNLGVALRNSHRYAAAIDAFREAVRLKPESADILSSLGEALGLIYHDDSLPTLRRSVVLAQHDPEKHWNLALDLLKRGEYLEGWSEHEVRWQRTRKQAPLRPFTQPYWRNEPGQSIAGTTILLHAEQGFGDTIQFLRYLPAVLALGAKIVLEVPPALLRLASVFAQQLEASIVIFTEGSPLPVFDFHTPLMSLPHAFATTIDTVPPPLRLTPPAPARPQHRPLRIGIAWSGNAAHDRDRERSIPNEALLPLFDVPGCEWISLQLGAANDQLRKLGVKIEQPPLHDFLDTANLIDTLDLVLAVDTAVAHLAATQGGTTWVLLPFVADWRWLRPATQITGTSTPWYPQAKVFRQTRLPSGEPQAELWAPVIAEVCAALAHLADQANLK